jgi:negative modulator of initiation of replication
MKYIEVDEELYRFIASKTERIGESASDILRRLLAMPVAIVAPFEPKAIDEPSLDTQHHQDQNQEAYKELQQELKKELVAQPIKKAYQPGQIDADKPATPARSTASFPSSADFNGLIQQHPLSQQKGAVGRFMWLLQGLAALAPSQFNKILQVQGKGRLYFARSKEELLASSASANPKEIGTTGYWVTTNNNTAKKQAILVEVLVKLHCDETVAQGVAEHI